MISSNQLLSAAGWRVVEDLSVCYDGHKEARGNLTDAQITAGYLRAPLSLPAALTYPYRMGYAYCKLGNTQMF